LLWNAIDSEDRVRVAVAGIIYFLYSVTSSL
jgi:hypothetical protein